MKLRGLLALLAGMTLFSTIEVASKIMQKRGAIAGNSPLWIATLRFLITGVILLLPSVHMLRRRSIKPARSDVIVLAGLGLIGVTVMSGFFHLAILYLPANAAALVFSCNPVFVVIFAALILNEKMTLQKTGAALLCIIGTGVLAIGKTAGISPRGIMLMIIALAAFAVYTVLFKKVTPRYGALPIAGLAALAGGIFLIPVALGFEGFPLFFFGTADWVGILYLALAGTALAYFLFIYGIGQVEAGIGAMSFFLKPFLAALFARLLLGENLTPPMLAGGTFILAGMAAALRKKKSAKFD
ncbi:MAG: EamA family transporter [Kiritimatiellales bacterium]